MSQPQQLQEVRQNSLQNGELGHARWQCCKI